MSLKVKKDEYFLKHKITFSLLFGFYTWVKKKKAYLTYVGACNASVHEYNMLSMTRKIGTTAIEKWENTGNFYLRELTVML